MVKMVIMDDKEAIIAEHNGNINDSSHACLDLDEYLCQIRARLRAGRREEALALVKQSLIHHPNEPVFLSYYGFLLVHVQKMYRRGIETCQKAIRQFQASGSCDDGMLYAVFYCNLGRAYAAAGKRNDARDVLRVGLSYDPGNHDMKKELRGLGIRIIKPPIPFLRRSNPLNKYIGMMLYKRKNATDVKKRAAS